MNLSGAYLCGVESNTYLPFRRSSRKNVVHMKMYYHFESVKT